MEKANVAAIEWNRKNPSDPVCVHTAAMVLAGIRIGDEKCGLEANTLFAGGYGACINHATAVRGLMRAALSPKAAR